MRRTLRTIVLLSGVFALALSACKGSTKGADKPPVTGRGKSTAAKPEDRTRCDVKGKRIVKLDINQDKQPDVWKLYKTRVEGGAKVDVLTCKERDLNFDGRKDIWYYYDDDGNLRMEEMDLDFDGRIDLVTIRRGGKVIRQELDTNYNGKVDVWRHFEEEVLTRVDRDTDHNGKVDYWEHYEGGRLDRIGYDRTGNGRVDVWDRTLAPPEPTAETEGDGESTDKTGKTDKKPKKSS